MIVFFCWWEADEDRLTHRNNIYGYWWQMAQLVWDDKLQFTQCNGKQKKNCSSAVTDKAWKIDKKNLTFKYLQNVGKTAGQLPQFKLQIASSVQTLWWEVRLVLLDLNGCPHLMGHLSHFGGTAALCPGCVTCCKVSQVQPSSWFWGLASWSVTGTELPQTVL